MRYRVKIDERLCILTPNQWPTNHFGNDNRGIVVDIVPLYSHELRRVVQPTAEIAKNEVAEDTGVSQSVLIAEPVA